jgi:hypothetical protein
VQREAARSGDTVGVVSSVDTAMPVPIEAMREIDTDSTSDATGTIVTASMTDGRAPTSASTAVPMTTGPSTGPETSTAGASASASAEDSSTPSPPGVSRRAPDGFRVVRRKLARGSGDIVTSSPTTAPVPPSAVARRATEPAAAARVGPALRRTPSRARVDAAPVAAKEAHASDRSEPEAVRSPSEAPVITAPVVARAARPLAEHDEHRERAALGPLFVPPTSIPEVRRLPIVPEEAPTSPRAASAQPARVRRAPSLPDRALVSRATSHRIPQLATVAARAASTDHDRHEIDGPRPFPSAASPLSTLAAADPALAPRSWPTSSELQRDAPPSPVTSHRSGAPLTVARQTVHHARKTEAFVPPVVQRAADASSTPSSPPAMPPNPPVAPASAPAASASPTSAPDTLNAPVPIPDLKEFAETVYRRVERRLRAELLRDRERKGSLADP